MSGARLEAFSRLPLPSTEPIPGLVDRKVLIIGTDHGGG